jgi:hypothetical protein
MMAFGADFMHLYFPRRISMALVALVLASATVLATEPRVSVSHTPAHAAQKTNAESLRALTALPTSFEANSGQFDPHIRFVSQAAARAVFLTDDEAIFAVQRVSAKAGASHSPRKGNLASVVRMRFEGANRRARKIGLDPLAARINYFVGNDPHKWRTNVPAYGRVKYREVYPGIDLVYYSNQNSIEFDLIASAKARTDAVRLSFDRAAHPRIDASGDLVLGAESEITLKRPRVYQDKERGVVPIEARYVLVDTKSSQLQRVAIALAGYDRNRPLVIDPQLVYSTFLPGGGSGGSNPVQVAVDSRGYACVAGTTYIPAVPPPFAGATQQEAFVSLVNPAARGANQLVYSTIFGGATSPNSGTLAFGVAASNLIYVTGETTSTDFPITAGAFQRVNTGEDDFVTVLNPLASGSASLIYSTFLGGSLPSPFGSVETADIPGNLGQAIAVDSAGLAYVTGITSQPDFPVTKGAFQTSLKGPANAFVSVVNPFAGPLAGQQSLVYSSYLGGSDSLENSGIAVADEPAGIAIGSNGEIYVAGTTASLDFPVTPHAFQLTNNNTTYQAGTNAFLTVLNRKLKGASQLVYSTYLGGENEEFANGLAIDSKGRAYLTGTTYSAGFPTTLNAFHLAPVLGSGAASGGGAFLSVIDPTAKGSASLLYSSLLSGASFNGSSSPVAVAVDKSGLAYLALGVTNDFPITADALQTQWVEQGASALSVINPMAIGDASLVYSTFFAGGTNSLAVNAKGRVYLIGSNVASNFPITAGAMQTTNPNMQFSFLSILAPSISPLAPAPKPAAITSALSPALLQFPATPGTLSGTTSQPMTVTLTAPKPTGANHTLLTIEGMATGGDFDIDSASTTCVSGQAIAAGGTCSIGVVFEPTGPGTRNGVLVISDNGKGSPHQISLTGTAVPGNLLPLGPTDNPLPTADTIDFGQVDLNTTAQSQLNFQTDSILPITVTDAQSSDPQFSATLSPQEPVCIVNAPGPGFCYVTVSFTPTTAGAQSGALTIDDDASNGPQTVMLSGTGQ